MRETTIDLLRTGEAQTADSESVFLGLEDVKLSKAGRNQMLTAVEGHGWDVILTSPLKRAVNAARTIGNVADAPVKTRKNLKEFDYGNWSNKPLAQFSVKQQARFAAFMNDPASVKPPKGQSFEAFRATVLETWRDITSCYAGQRVLLVTHNMVIRVVLADVLAIQNAGHLRVEVPHACFSRIKLFEGDWPPSLQFHCPPAPA